MGFKARIDIAEPITIALSKGRILGPTLDVFERAGFDVSEARSGSRKLVHKCGPLEFLVLRSADVPTYVDHGAADLGVVGLDVLVEADRDLYQPVDLGLGACRMIVAELGSQPVDLSSQLHLRVATKYPVIARKHLQARGITAEVIKLAGAIELAPIIGLAHRIVDLVETGETLRQNGLVEIETLMDITTRVIVNRASLKRRPDELSAILDRLENAVSSGT